MNLDATVHSLNLKCIAKLLLLTGASITP